MPAVSLDGSGHDPPGTTSPAGRGPDDRRPLHDRSGPRGLVGRGVPIPASGNTTPEQLAADIAHARGLGTAFGVNLFVFPLSEIDEEAFADYAEELSEDAARLGVTPHRRATRRSTTSPASSAPEGAAEDVILWLAKGI